MKKAKIQTVPFRRKREGKTNYKKRLKLLSSGKNRLVIRRFVKNILVQIVEYKAAGDKVLVSASSRELIKLGWKMSLSSLPASYLTGLLLGKKAKKANLKEAILDTGLLQPTNKSRVYAALKGAVDGGIQVPHSKDILPAEDRISGSHIETYAKKIAGDKKIYERQFSQYIKKGIKPEEIKKHFEDIKNKIKG